MRLDRPIAAGAKGGHGPVRYHCTVRAPGRVLFELSGVSETVAREALTRAIHKLPLKARIIKREEGDA